MERDVRRREEVGSAAGELAIPQNSKDMPIALDSDPRKRRAVKAATAVASSGSSQMESSRAVADTPTQQSSMAHESRVDVEAEERDGSRSSQAQDNRRRIMTKTSREECQMDDEGKDREESISSTEPNTRPGRE